jgi:hypothetical protein
MSVREGGREEGGREGGEEREGGEGGGRGGGREEGREGEDYILLNVHFFALTLISASLSWSSPT